MIGAMVEERFYENKKEATRREAKPSTPDGQLDSNRHNSVNEETGYGDNESFWSRIKQKDALIEGLKMYEDSHPGAQRIRNALSRCVAFVEVKRGVPAVVVNACRNKSCPFCNAHRLHKQRQPLVLLLKKAVLSGQKYGLITLTVRHDAQMSASLVRYKLGKVWSRFNSDKNAKKYLVSAFKMTEVTKGKNGFHYHLHLLAVVDGKYDWSEAKQNIRQRWIKHGGGVVFSMKRYDDQHRRDEKGLMKAVLEMTCYATKGNKDFRMKDWVEVVVANRGKQDFSYLGGWRKEVIEMREEIKAGRNKDIEPCPSFPNPMDKTTGEVASLEDGRYKPQELKAKAATGCWSSKYYLNLLGYYIRWSWHPDFTSNYLQMKLWFNEHAPEAEGKVSWMFR